MSPRRDLRRLIRPTIMLLTLLVAGCIFSPKDPGKKVDPPITPAKNQTELIANLSKAYQTRNYDVFSDLFSTAADSAAYLFFLNDGGPPPYWDLTEELRIHRRMFNPENPLPGETPVDPNLWLASIDIHLEPQTEWTERPDLYISTSNPNGLNPARYKVTDAQYHTYVLFATQGPTSYQVNGRANFVVVEDLHKTVGENRKFLIYRWEDLGALSAKSAPPAI
jgi:hypothetical protein